MASEFSWDDFFDGGDLRSSPTTKAEPSTDALEFVAVLKDFFPRGTPLVATAVQGVFMVLGSHVITFYRNKAARPAHWVAEWGHTIGMVPFLTNRGGGRLPAQVSMATEIHPASPQSLRRWLNKVASGIITMSAKTFRDALNPDNFLVDNRPVFQTAFNLDRTMVTPDMIEEHVSPLTLAWTPTKVPNRYIVPILRKGAPIGFIVLYWNGDCWTYGIKIDHREIHPLFGNNVPIEHKHKAPTTLKLTSCHLDEAKKMAERLYVRKSIEWLLTTPSFPILRNL